jgi:hypothetical protein
MGKKRKKALHITTEVVDHHIRMYACMHAHTNKLHATQSVMYVMNRNESMHVSMYVSMHACMPLLVLIDYAQKIKRI